MGIVLTWTRGMCVFQNGSTEVWMWFLSHTCTCIHIHSFTLSLSFSLTHTHTHTHTLTLSLSLSLSHTHIHTHTNAMLEHYMYTVYTDGWPLSLTLADWGCTCTYSQCMVIGWFPDFLCTLCISSMRSMTEWGFFGVELLGHLVKWNCVTIRQSWGWIDSERTITVR